MAERSVPPDLIPIPEFRYAEPADYDASLSPEAALAKFPFEPITAVTQIHRELEVARVVGIAEHAIWRRDGETSQAYFLIVTTWFWSIETPLVHDFWVTGYRERLFPAKGYGISGDNWIKLFAIRFWFANSSTELPSKPAEPTERQEKPVVSRQELANWHEVFKSVHPSAVEAFAQRSAKAMFPDNHVPRSWVRELRGPQKRGKPATRHE